MKIDVFQKKGRKDNKGLQLKDSHPDDSVSRIYKRYQELYITF